MLTDLQKQNEVAMTELGLLIPANQIYNPDGIALKDAVVHFGGGCTGEVISAEGLVLTNHHCGYGAIQQHSSVEHDYLTDGFWAMSREEELPCKYNPQIEMFARFKTKSSFHKTKRII